MAAQSDDLQSDQYAERLRAAGITRGSVPFRELTAAAKRSHPLVRNAVYQYLHRMYVDAGRDFCKAFSYPEFVQVAPGVWLPLLHVWDRPHGLKNARTTAGHAVKRADNSGGAAATGASPHAPTNGLDAALAAALAAARGHLTGVDAAPDAEDAPNLVSDDEDDEDAVGDAPAGTMAYEVGMALKAIIDTPGQTLLHARTLDPGADPQHVPTAERAFSLETAEQVKRNGHLRAAAFVKAMACDYLSIDKRGFSPVARWMAREDMDATIRALSKSFEWDPTSSEWHSPSENKGTVGGFSRVLAQSFLISNESSRLLDVMIGPEACRFVRDRAKGSDLCECFFSCCVAKMRQDKVSKYQWLKFLPSIIRMLERKTMDIDDRQSCLFTNQRHIYKFLDFIKGFRCCCCSPPCLIGGVVNPSCACAEDGRHKKETDKKMQRDSMHPERSIRRTYFAVYAGGVCLPCLGGAAAAIDVDAQDHDAIDVDAQDHAAIDVDAQDHTAIDVEAHGHAAIDMDDAAGADADADGAFDGAVDADTDDEMLEEGARADAMLAAMEAEGDDLALLLAGARQRPIDDEATRAAVRVEMAQRMDTGIRVNPQLVAAMDEEMLDAMEDA